MVQSLNNQVVLGKREWLILTDNNKPKPVGEDGQPLSDKPLKKELREPSQVDEESDNDENVIGFMGDDEDIQQAQYNVMSLIENKIGGLDNEIGRITRELDILVQRNRDDIDDLKKTGGCITFLHNKCGKEKTYEGCSACATYYHEQGELPEDCMGDKSQLVQNFCTYSSPNYATGEGAGNKERIRLNFESETSGSPPKCDGLGHFDCYSIINKNANLYQKDNKTLCIWKDVQVGNYKNILDDTEAKCRNLCSTYNEEDCDSNYCTWSGITCLENLCENRQTYGECTNNDKKEKTEDVCGVSVNKDKDSKFFNKWRGWMGFLSNKPNRDSSGEKTCLMQNGDIKAMEERGIKLFEPGTKEEYCESEYNFKDGEIRKSLEYRGNFDHSAIYWDEKSFGIQPKFHSNNFSLVNYDSATAASIPPIVPYCRTAKNIGRDTITYRGERLPRDYHCRTKGQTPDLISYYYDINKIDRSIDPQPNPCLQDGSDIFSSPGEGPPGNIYINGNKDAPRSTAGLGKNVACARLNPEISAKEIMLDYEGAKEICETNEKDNCYYGYDVKKDNDELSPYVRTGRTMEMGCYSMPDRDFSGKKMKPYFFSAYSDHCTEKPPKDHGRKDCLANKCSDYNNKDSCANVNWDEGIIRYNNILRDSEVDILGNGKICNYKGTADGECTDSETGFRYAYGRLTKYKDFIGYFGGSGFKEICDNYKEGVWLYPFLISFLTVCLTTLAFMLIYCLVYYFNNDSLPDKNFLIITVIAAVVNFFICGFAYRYAVTTEKKLMNNCASVPNLSEIDKKNISILNPGGSDNNLQTKMDALYNVTKSIATTENINFFKDVVEYYKQFNKDSDGNTVNITDLLDENISWAEPSKLSEQFIIKDNSYWDPKYIVYIFVITLLTLIIINVAFEDRGAPTAQPGDADARQTAANNKFKFNVSIYTSLLIVVLGLIIVFYSQSSYITADSHKGVSSSPGINSDETNKLYTINSEHYSELRIPSTVSDPVELKEVYFCGEPTKPVSPVILQTLKIEKLAQQFASNDSENLNRYDELYVKDSDTYERGHIALLIFFIVCLLFFIIGAGGTAYYRHDGWIALSDGMTINDETRDFVVKIFLGLSLSTVVAYVISALFIGSFDFWGQDYEEGGIHVNYSSSSPGPGESQIEEIIKEFKGDDDLSTIYNSIAEGDITYNSSPQGECAEINKDKGGFCKSSNYDDDILGNIPPKNFKPSTDYCIDENKWNTMVDNSTLEPSLKDLYKKQPILNNLLKDTTDNYLIDHVFTTDVVDFLKKIYKLRDDSDFEWGWFIILIITWLMPGGFVTMMNKWGAWHKNVLKYCLVILSIIPLGVTIWFINRWWEYREMKQMGADIMNIISGRYNAWNGELHGSSGTTDLPSDSYPYDNCSNSQECYVQLDSFRSRGKTAKKITIPESTDKDKDIVKDIFTYECNKLGGCTNEQFSKSSGNILPGECMDNGFTVTDTPPEYAGKEKGSDWENCRERDKIFTDNPYPGLYKDVPIWGGGGRWWGSEQTDEEYSIEKSFNSDRFKPIYDKEPWLMYTQVALGVILLLCLLVTINYDADAKKSMIGCFVFSFLILISICVYVGIACYNHYHYKNDSWGIRFEPFNKFRNSGDKMVRQTNPGKKNKFFNYGDEDDYIGNNSGWQVIVIMSVVFLVLYFIYTDVGLSNIK